MNIKKKGIFSKLTASVLSAMMLFGGGAFAVQTGYMPAINASAVSTITAEPLSNTSKLVKTTIVKGKKAEVKFSASGGSGKYKFSLYYKRSSESKWKSAVLSTEEPTGSFTPKYSGDYNVSVRAVDSSGTIKKKAMTLKVLLPLSNKSEVEKTQITKGESIRVNFSASGGSGGYKYSLFYKRSSEGKWKEAVSETTASYKTFKPKYSGDYDVSAKVVDSLGNVKKKRFTVNVKLKPSEFNLEYEAQVLELVNIERKNIGLKPLSLDEKLVQVAHTRAKEITESFSHTRPDGRSCFSAAKDAGVSYFSAAENIAYGYSTPKAVMNAWMNSSGHKKNILSESLTKIGIGCYKNSDGMLYWSQFFIG